MDIRVLRYFLAAAGAESLTEAAESLNITQPTLSRQIMELEEELGVQLYARGCRCRKMCLTEDGRFLKEKAQEILALTQKTLDCFNHPEGVISGEVSIGLESTSGCDVLFEAATLLKKTCPAIEYSFNSLYMDRSAQEIQKGILDFGLACKEPLTSDYEFLPLPVRDIWGLYLNTETESVIPETISHDALNDYSLIALKDSRGLSLLKTCMEGFDSVKPAAWCHSIYNALELVDQGFGAFLGVGREVPCNISGHIVFVPFGPEISQPVYLIWKKTSSLSRPARFFLETVQELVAHKTSPHPDAAEEDIQAD